ncbi:aminotransferase class III-fold pyridoxal phosphate-dependent enzyme [bacterium]|nr:aminotransferase class III-fold pyridoxal phosphate-dependent enzyme [bacterium]
MIQKNEFFESIVNNRQKHPERLNASFNRIEEVLQILSIVKADEIIEKCKTEIDHSRNQLTDNEGVYVYKTINSLCTEKELKRIAELLFLSEISTKEAISLHEEYKIPVSHLEKDIIPISGDGAWITDNVNRRFLDMDSNYSATNLGMSNREIALGIYNQAIQLISMKEDRVHIPRTRFLKNIHEMLPDGLTQFYWQNSGGEAVDKALKIAKAYTKNAGVVAMKGGFHGRTHGAVSVTYEEKYRKPFFLHNQDWVHFVEFNDAEAVKNLFEKNKAKTVILELVQGEEAGIRPAEREFPKKLRDICDQYNGVMIVDEIQTGFGRTAEKENQWFASMVYDVIPDIMTIGKSFGGGYPVTAVVTNKQVSNAMKPGYDGSTFGGNPMAMVAAMIATRQMREKNITKNVIERSQQIINGLKRIRDENNSIGEIRGLGLMLSFQLSSPEKVAEFQKEIARNGVKTSLSTREWVRFLPPLIISKTDVDFLLKAIAQTLQII